MAERLKARQSPGLGFIGIDREGLIVASARMRNMIDTTAQCTLGPGINNFKLQGCIHF